jgi:glycosyltransferase involved in cell wall biosynthesis
MTSVIKYYEGIDSVAVIGNYLPRQCGIATFTTDLVEGLSAEAPDIYCCAVAMNDKPEGYPYPEKVRFEINQNKLTDYSVASQFLNISQTDIVCVQHEYGLFGGPAGSHLLKLLGDLHMPVVTTLHTVLKDPPPEHRAVMCKLSDLSDKLVVMSHRASDFLKDIYAVPEDKIVFIHHGIPDTPFIDPSFNKDKFGVEGKKVLLTFGLLSPNKGIENVLQALPAVIKKHPDVAYIILGATHPHILKLHGDAYRIMLQQLVRKLDIGAHVIFQKRFVELKELCEFLGIADIYVTPYLEEAQITSQVKPSFQPHTGTPPRCLPKAGAGLCPSVIRMPWRNKSSTFWKTMSTGTPCARKPTYSAATRFGRRYPENISRFSGRFS